MLQGIAGPGVDEARQVQQGATCAAGQQEVQRGGHITLVGYTLTHDVLSLLRPQWNGKDHSV